MTSHRPTLTRLAVVTLCLCSAVFGAVTTRETTLAQYRCIPERQQSPTQPQLIRFHY